MKVLLVNGSSRSNGCTNEALTEVARALSEEGIDTEMIFIGNEALPDCIACRKCSEIGRCVFNDAVNEFVEKAKTADGFVFGSLAKFNTFQHPCHIFPDIIHGHQSFLILCNIRGDCQTATEPAGNGKYRRRSGV